VGLEWGGSFREVLHRRKEVIYDDMI